MTLGKTFREVVTSTVPVVLVVYLIQAFILKSPANEQMMFLLCTLFLIVGLTFFLYGVETGVNPVGESIGSEIPKRKSRMFMVGVVFAISFLATVAEPNVAVFAEQVHSVYETLGVNSIVYAIAVGVAVFLLIAAIRIVYSVSLKILLTVGYGLVLVLAILAPSAFVGIAFDSGGVMTGPMIIPVLLSLSLGICIGRSSSKMEGFGTVGLAFIGPLLALLIMGIFIGTGETGSSVISDTPYDLDMHFLLKNFKNVLKDVVVAMVPLVAFFIFFQRAFLKYTWRAVKRMLVGLTMSSVGMIVLLTGVYTGFMPVVSNVGGKLLAMGPAWMVGLGFVLGVLVVLAEPAAKVLAKQVEDSSRGAITGSAILTVIALGVGTLVAVGMLRVYTGVSLLWIVGPALILALALMWKSDPDFVGIAFDGGAVATGPVSVAVVMPMYVGIASSNFTGMDAVANGFGIIFLMSLAPMIFVNAMGIYLRKKREEAMNGFNSP